LDKELQEAADRHVGDRVEVVEDHAVVTRELPPKLGFDRLLLRREECADRVVDQVQDQAAPLHSIPQSVQELQGADRLFKNSVPALGVGLGRTKIGERGNYLGPMVDQKLGQIALRGKQENAQVTPIHHVTAEASRLFDQPAE